MASQQQREFSPEERMAKLEKKIECLETVVENLGDFIASLLAEKHGRNISFLEGDFCISEYGEHTNHNSCLFKISSFSDLSQRFTKDYDW